MLSPVSDDSDDQAPDQISFAQSRAEELESQKNRPAVQGKKRKRNRRADRKQVTDSEDQAPDSTTTSSSSNCGVKKEEVVQISLPHRTIEVRSGLKTGTSLDRSPGSDFKETSLSQRKRVTRISTSSRLLAYRAEKQAYR